MISTATTPTAAKRAIGPQLRPWLTLTGAIGLRGPPPPFLPEGADGLAPGLAAGLPEIFTEPGLFCSPLGVLMLIVVVRRSKGWTRTANQPGAGARVYPHCEFTRRPAYTADPPRESSPWAR